MSVIIIIIDHPRSNVVYYVVSVRLYSVYFLLVHIRTFGISRENTGQGWLFSTVVERRYFAGKLSPSYV